MRTELCTTGILVSVSVWLEKCEDDEDNDELSVKTTGKKSNGPPPLLSRPRYFCIIIVREYVSLSLSKVSSYFLRFEFVE